MPLFIACRNQETSPYAFQHFKNPEYVLINGLGRIPGGPKSPLAVVNVKPRLRYRFRLVNIACVAAFNFSIDGHTMTVIETDGTEAEPSKPVDIVTVWVGQRVSVIVEANQRIDNYCECDLLRNGQWRLTRGAGIRAAPFIMGSTFSNETGLNTAILRYAGAPNAEPTTTQTGSSLFEEQDLIVRILTVLLSVTDWMMPRLVNQVFHVSPGSRGGSRYPT